MSERRRRSSGKIDRLPAHLKDTVNQMLLGGRYYKDIVGFLKEHGHELSQMSVHRYAEKYLVQAEELQLLQENFRLLAEETDKYPNLDTTEVIMRLASQQVLNALTSLPSESWSETEPDKLLKNATALIRAASYKRKTDLQVQTDKEAALEANKELLFTVLSRKHPDLYGQVMDVLNQEQALLQEGDELQ